MKTYTFQVVVEPDEDRWHAHCPALEQYGAATWGSTHEEALKHIQEVVQMVAEELAGDGIPIAMGPDGASSEDKIGVALVTVKLLNV
jgi:predicted RNase H-like HicB family nuclease